MTVVVHHIALTAADLTKGAAFYDEVLGVLGYARRHNSPRLATWAGPGTEFLLYAAEGAQTDRHRHGRPGLQHVALQVAERDTVDAARAAAVRGGGHVVHEPRPYPEYAEGYYAVFVEDPDGSRIEIAYIPVATH